MSVCRVGHCLPCHRFALEVLGHDFPWAPWLSVGSNWVFGVASQAVQRTDVSGRPVLFEEGHASTKAFLWGTPGTAKLRLLIITFVYAAIGFRSLALSCRDTDGQ